MPASVQKPACSPSKEYIIITRKHAFLNTLLLFLNSLARAAIRSLAAHAEDSLLWCAQWEKLRLEAEAAALRECTFAPKAVANNRRHLAGYVPIQDRLGDLQRRRRSLLLMHNPVDSISHSPLRGFLENQHPATKGVCRKTRPTTCSMPQPSNAVLLMRQQECLCTCCSNRLSQTQLQERQILT